MKSIVVAAVAFIAFLIIPTSVAEAASGLIYGHLQFYQNQGTYCPAGSDCTGARYLESEWHTNRPVRNVKVYMRDDSGNLIGTGCTDNNGQYVISWFSGHPPYSAFQGNVYWSSEHCDGRFNVRSGTGATWIMWTHNQFIYDENILPVQYFGVHTWGSPSSPHAVANIYDGAERTWRDSLRYSTLLVSRVNNVEIRAVNTQCPTSCAMGNQLIHLDTDATTPYAYASRVAHELGHIASHMASRGRNSNACVNACWPNSTCTNGNWLLDSPEWGCMAFEEAVANWFANTSRYWSIATQPTTCFPTLDECEDNLEESTAVNGTCATNESRWPISIERFLWDIYDHPNDSELEAGRIYNSIPDGLFLFQQPGNLNRWRDEWQSGDLDGRGGFDFQALYSAAHGVSVLPLWANNCSPPGD